MEIKDSVSRDKALRDFIRKMTEPTVNIKADHESFVEELERIYLLGKTEGVHRHSYARLSHYLYDDVDNEAIGICIENLADLEPFVVARGNDDLLKAFRKLEDHIDLECIHMGQLSELKMSMNGAEQLISEFPNISAKVTKIEETIEAANKAIEQYDTDVKDLKDQIKEQTVQSISILGIFAGVVFAFSGGFSMLSSTLNNIHLISGKQTLFFFSTTLGIGCILYDVVFALMVFVGRYCDKEPRNVWGFTKVLNGMVFATITMLMIIYCLCYNGDIRLIP